jgi:hypothetical protein
LQSERLNVAAAFESWLPSICRLKHAAVIVQRDVFPPRSANEDQLQLFNVKLPLRPLAQGGFAAQTRPGSHVRGHFKLASIALRVEFVANEVELLMSGHSRLGFADDLKRRQASPFRSQARPGLVRLTCGHQVVTSDRKESTRKYGRPHGPEPRLPPGELPALESADSAHHNWDGTDGISKGAVMVDDTDNITAWNDRFHIEAARLHGKSWASSKATPEDLRNLEGKWRAQGLDRLGSAIDTGSLNAEQLAKEINPSYTEDIFNPSESFSEGDAVDSIQGIDTAFRGVDAAYLRAFCTGVLEYWDETRQAKRASR